jgi:hypothetical protein
MLIKDVLGKDWQQLPPVIQRHYALEDNQTCCLEGTMHIDYPYFMFPLIWIIHLFGGLVLWRGEAVATRVLKTASAKMLNWQRMMTYADGRMDYFRSQMRYVGDYEIIENIGFGFGLRLLLRVENGDLIYRSNGHFWQCGNWVINIPDCLLLGAASISEQALSDEEFYLDFTIQHPWWGETYSYRGCFRYC